MTNNIILGFALGWYISCYIKLCNNGKLNPNELMVGIIAISLGIIL